MATRVNRKAKVARKTRRLPRAQKGGRKVLDARSKKDVKLFENMIVTGPLTLVFAKLQGCGPCERFNKDVWSHLTKLKKRGMNLASIDSELIKNTSLGVQPKAYPTLLLVGKDRKPATFKDENGQPTNSMPRKNTLEEDRAALTALVQAPTSQAMANETMKSQSANARSVASPGASPLASLTPSPVDSSTSAMQPSLSPEVPRTVTSVPLRDSQPRQIMNSPSSLYDDEPEVPSMMNTMASIKKKNKTQGRPRSTVPDVASDLLATQTKTPTASAAVIARETKQGVPPTGGSLLQALRKQNAAYKAVLDMRKRKYTVRNRN
jgi:hypothetical protein